MERLKILAILLGIWLALLTTGCTAQQWQTTKEAMALTALVGLAVAVDSQRYYVPTTRCETVSTAYGYRSHCETY